MALHQYHFLMPRGMKAQGIAEFLRAQGIRVRPPHRRSMRREFYDSFDWRLYEAGLTLIADRVADRIKLYLRSLKSGLDIVAVEAAEPPGFARDLTRGVLRDRLAPLLAERRLLPRVALDRKTQTIEVLDDETKTVAHIEIERHRVVPGKQMRPVALGERVAVLPVRGYEEPLKRLRDLFEHQLGLVRLNGTALEEALAAIGRHPLDYSSKPRIALTHEMNAGEAARRIFSALLAIIEANEDGVRRDLDTEFLHDLRVSVRRTRSLLAQWKKFLPPACAHFRQEFAWLGEVTGPTRDLDVHMHDLTGYAALFDIEVRGDLVPLREAMRSRRAVERGRMLDALASPRYVRLKETWRALLETADNGEWSSEPMLRPLPEIASAVLRKRYHKVYKLGQRLTPDSPDAEFHELRKQCKKLRYLMEFFAALYPRGEVKRLVKALRGLQDNLGTYQDISVQIAVLPSYIEEMDSNGDRLETARTAVTLLSNHLEERRRELHAEFAAAWSRFARQDVRDRFDRLFAEDEAQSE